MREGPISSPFPTGRRMGAISIAQSGSEHHSALSKLMRTGIHGSSTSAYTWELTSAA